MRALLRQTGTVPRLTHLAQLRGTAHAPDTAVSYNKMVISLPLRLTHTSCNEGLEPLTDFYPLSSRKQGSGCGEWPFSPLPPVLCWDGGSCPAAFPTAEETSGRQAASLPLVPTRIYRIRKPSAPYRLLCGGRRWRNKCPGLLLQQFCVRGWFQI